VRNLVLLLFQQKWRLPTTHEKEPKGLWLNMLDLTVTTTNPINLIGGLLETRRVLKSITNCTAGRSSLLPKC